MQTNINTTVNRPTDLPGLSTQPANHQCEKSSIDKITAEPLHTHDGKPLTLRNVACKNPALFERWYTKPEIMTSDFIGEHIAPCLKSFVFLPSGEHRISKSEFFNPEDMMFGEEFEYTTNIEHAKSSEDDYSSLFDTYTPDTPSTAENFEQLLLAWEDKLTSKLNELNISDFDIEHKRSRVEERLLKDWRKKSYQGFKEEYITALNVKIGEWHCVIFQDRWDCFLLLEVNASPYKLEQTFKVNGEDWKVSDLFTNFITSIADKFSPKNNETSRYTLEYASGHKHVDLRDSVGGNPELLFRMLVEMEDKAWLTRYFDTHGYSSTSHKFATQGQYNEIKTSVLKNLIETYNNAIKDKENSGIACPEIAINLPLIKFWWHLFAVPENKLIPLFLNKFEPSFSNYIAKSGQVDQKPWNTAEFRIYNCSRDGNEAIMISQFIKSWLETVYQDINDRKPLNYEPCNPSDPMNNQELTEKFVLFIKRLGLPETFQRLYRSPAQE